MRNLWYRGCESSRLRETRLFPVWLRAKSQSECIHNALSIFIQFRGIHKFIGFAVVCGRNLVEYLNYYQTFEQLYGNLVCRAYQCYIHGVQYIWSGEIHLYPALLVEYANNSLVCACVRLFLFSFWIYLRATYFTMDRAWSITRLYNTFPFNRQFIGQLSARIFSERNRYLSESEVVYGSVAIFLKKEKKGIERDICSTLQRSFCCNTRGNISTQFERERDGRAQWERKLLRQ